MPIIPSPSSTGPGPSSLVVDTLRNFSRPLPLDYLAKVLGRTRSEIEAVVHELELARVVHRIDADTITLSK